MCSSDLGCKYGRLIRWKLCTHRHLLSRHCTLPPEAVPILSKRPAAFWGAAHRASARRGRAHLGAARGSVAGREAYLDAHVRRYTPASLHAKVHGCLGVDHLVFRRAQMLPQARRAVAVGCRAIQRYGGSASRAARCRECRGAHRAVQRISRARRRRRARCALFGGRSLPIASGDRN